MNIPFEVYSYVDPATGDVTGMLASHILGVSKRENNTWEPVFNRQEVLDLTDGKIMYEINWTKTLPTDYVAAEDEDYDEEHPLVLKFDAGTATKEDVENYSDLVVDENGERPDLDFGI